MDTDHTTKKVLETIIDTLQEKATYHEYFDMREHYLDRVKNVQAYYKRRYGEYYKPNQNQNQKGGVSG